MRVWYVLPCFIAVLLLSTCAACSEDLVEVWRSPWGVVTSVSVDSADGSCWAAVGDKVIHFGADGTVLGETPGFLWPSAVSANRADGSCWVSEYGNTYHEHYWAPEDGGERVAHIGEDGEVLWSRAGFNSVWDLSANPTDGSCWVAHTGNDEVVHLAAEGSELWRGGDFDRPLGVSVNEADGSCWVADTYNWQMAHLAEDGSQLWRDERFLGPPEMVSVNPADGSCWVAGDLDFDDVNHLAADGTLLDSFSVGGAPTSLSVNSADGSWWVSTLRQLYGPNPDYHEIADVRHYGADGTELWRQRELWWPESVSVNSADGSCWVADSWAHQIIHLNEQGSELLRVGDASSPICVSVNPTDGSAWVIDQHSHGAGVLSFGASELVHYGADGEELWRGGDLEAAYCVSVDSSDGSCWVSDLGVWDSVSEEYVGGAVVHVAADGTEIQRVTEVAAPFFLSVNSNDGSCWVGDSEADDLVHLAADGTVLWRGGDISHPGRIAASPSDDSCWVIDCGEGILLHIAADGTEIGRSDDGGWMCQLAVNPEDGSCWVGDMSSVRHYSADGEKLSDTPVMCCAWALAVDPRDGSCWVAANSSFDLVHLSSEGIEVSRQKGVLWTDSIDVNALDGSLWVADISAGQVAHLAAPLFLDVAFGFWANREIALCSNANIISGYDDGLYRPDLPVTRDQMAVYISRAIAGGDANIPLGPRTPSFLDVPRSHWAYEHIEYAKANGIVAGYSGVAFHPDLTVNRAQMAVYIARALVAPAGEGGVPAGPAGPSFPDITRDGDWAWCYDHVEYIAAEGVAQGCDDGKYHPERDCTRDARAFGLLP